MQSTAAVAPPGVVEVALAVAVEDDVAVEGAVGGAAVVAGASRGLDRGTRRAAAHELGMVVMCKEPLMLGTLAAADCP
jgi:hypothetical protein